MKKSVIPALLVMLVDIIILAVLIGRLVILLPYIANDKVPLDIWDDYFADYEFTYWSARLIVHLSLLGIHDIVQLIMVLLLGYAIKQEKYKSLRVWCYVQTTFLIFEIFITLFFYSRAWSSPMIVRIVYVFYRVISIIIILIHMGKISTHKMTTQSSIRFIHEHDQEPTSHSNPPSCKSWKIPHTTPHHQTLHGLPCGRK